MVQHEAQDKAGIDVREAIRIARDYIVHLYEEPLPNLMLEEVTVDDDGNYWYITFGFDTDRPRSDVPSMFTNAQPKYVRAYKLITVRASDGKVMSMKIREV